MESRVVQRCTTFQKMSIIAIIIYVYKKDGQRCPSLQNMSNYNVISNYWYLIIRLQFEVKSAAKRRATHGMAYSIFV